MPIPIDFENFLGIHAGKTKPPRNSAQILENFDLRGLSGALEQRTGYNLLYDAKPLGIGLDVLTTNHLVLENIYIPEVGGGKEIQIIVGNGIATSQQDNDAAYTKDVSCVWASHKYHPGTDTWVDVTEDGWNWLNEIVFTTVRAVHGTDLYKIRLDIVSATYITDDYFKNFSVVNLTTGEIFKIIKTFEYSATNNVGIYISSENHNFTTGDQLALMRTYIPMAYVEGNSDATANEISIVKVNNDIKIGFGGYENRVGLTVGYRKSFMQIKAFEFYSASDAELEEFGHVDGLVCSAHTSLFDVVDVDLTSTAGGTLDADIYYLRVTNLLDGLSELLLNGDSNISILANYDLSYNVRLKIGAENIRSTEVKIYFSSDSLLKAYRFIASEIIRKDTWEKKYTIDNDGYLILNVESVELNTNTNAASPELVTDPAAIANWSSLGTLTSVADAGAGSINVIQFQDPTYKRYFYFAPTAGLTRFANYDISFYAKMNLGAGEIKVRFAGDGTASTYQRVVQLTDSYQAYNFVLQNGDNTETLTFYINMASTNGVRIDRLSIKISGKAITSTTPERGSLISDEMGYPPSLNIVKSWDQAKLTTAKLLYVNAWINERNVNKIFFSHISGLGAASMWDAITASGYYDTENGDGNDLKGIELLRNLDLLTLNSNSNLRIDSDTGRSIDLGVGSGTENIKAAVNLGDRILYPGKFDILQTNGVNTESVSFGTVSETYRALNSTHKGLMRAIREENKSSYRFYLGNATSKEELILTPFGWQSAKRNLTPVSYALKRDGTVLFLNNGYIYQDIDGSGDNQVAISSKFKSIPIDNELIPEMKADDIIVVTDWWVFFFGTNSITMNLYLDYSGTAYDTQIVPPAGSTKTKYKRPVKVKDIGPASCSCFEFELICAPSVVDTYGGGKAAGTIISAGLTIEIIPGRLHA